MAYKHLVALAFLIALSSCFTLQGNWAYVDPQAAAGQEEVTLEIKDFVFRKEQIRQKLTFRGCQEMLLQSQFSQNQVFISPSTYLTQKITGKSCEGVSRNPLNIIFNGLASVFYFQININQLLLNDPYGKTIFTFKRVINAEAVDLSGIWTMNQYASTRTSLSVQIGPKAVTFCQGMAVYSYSLPKSRNKIELTMVRNTCPSTELTAAVESVQYFRKQGDILTLFNQDIVVAVEMIFRQAYNPEQPIFGSNARPTPPPASTRPRPSRVATPPPTAGISISNLSGEWSIITIFDIPFPNSPYSLSIDQTSITLMGGCNTHTFPYTLNATTQIITVENGSSTRKACQDSDDQLYISGVTKMYKYLVTSNAKGHFLNFYDNTGNIGYSLEIKNQNSANTGSVAGPTAPPKNQPFANGVVLMLLLNRRDLPRAVTTINGDTLSYSGCNRMTHKFIIADPQASQGSIEISLLSQTEMACPNNNDQLYVEALNSAVSYIHDPRAKTIIFTNLAGEDVVTFNRT